MDANAGKVGLCGQAAKAGGFDWAVYTAYSYTFAPVARTFAHDKCVDNAMLEPSAGNTLWCPGGPTGRRAGRVGLQVREGPCPPSRWGW